MRCFVSRRDLVLSEFQIARAKAAGASAVTVAVGFVGEERCGELVAFCKKLGKCSAAPWGKKRGRV